MFMGCPGCHRNIRWWEKRFPQNTIWHHCCWEAWQDGHATASKFAEDMCERVGAPTPGEIYVLTNSYNTEEQFTLLLKNLKKKYGQARRKRFVLNI